MPPEFTEVLAEHPEHLKRGIPFFAAIGLAITRWAMVDRELSNIWQSCLGTDDNISAMIFYRSPSISDHLRLVDLIIPTKIHPSHLKEWKSMSSAIGKLAEVRNIIAHEPARVLSYLPPAPLTWAIRARALKVRVKGKPKQTLLLKDIEDHYDEVTGMARKLNKFHSRLRGGQLSQP